MRLVKDVGNVLSIQTGVVTSTRTPAGDTSHTWRPQMESPMCNHARLTILWSSSIARSFSPSSPWAGCCFSAYQKTPRELSNGAASQQLKVQRLTNVAPAHRAANAGTTLIAPAMYPLPRIQSRDTSFMRQAIRVSSSASR